MSSKAALVVLFAGFLTLWCFSGNQRSVVERPELSNAHTFGNLSVFIVRGADVVDAKKILTLQEALEKGLAIVHETSSVNMLAVENLSTDHELFLQSGDIVKGGKQDRLISQDMLVQVKSGQVPCPANCCEQSRWQARGGEAAGKFEKSTDFAVGNAIKVANVNREQGGVWENVAKTQAALSVNLGKPVTLNASPTSLQLALEDRDLQAKVAQYETALSKMSEQYPDAIGVVVAVNGEVIAADTYGSHLLFQKAWPKLLKSAAVDAVAQMPKDSVLANASRWDAERFLAAKDNGVANASSGIVGIDIQASQYALLEPVNRPTRPGLPLIPALQGFAGRSSSTHSRDLSAGGANSEARSQVLNVSQQVAIPTLTPDVSRFSRLGSPTGNSGEQMAQQPATSMPSPQSPSSGLVSFESRAGQQGNALIHRGKLKK
jgi:hypothetical protein